MPSGRLYTDLLNVGKRAPSSSTLHVDRVGGVSEPLVVCGENSVVVERLDAAIAGAASLDGGLICHHGE